MKTTSALTLCALLFAGCVNTKYRTDINDCSAGPTDSKTCPRSPFITLKSDLPLSSSPSVAFFEFNRDGNVFGTLDPTTMEYPPDTVTEDAVLAKLRALNDSTSEDLLMIVFIHGWNHNAMSDDPNVKDFQDFLVNIANDQERMRKLSPSSRAGHPRKVVGIYFGWQGYAVDNEIGRFLSFRNKKELGLRTGPNGAIKVLREIAAIRNDKKKDSRLVTIGHSFGGGVLFSAIKDDLIKDIREGSTDGPVYGDIAVLVEPAVEAGAFVELQKLQNDCHAPGSALRMASFTSEADGDLSWEFTAGMLLFYPIDFWTKYDKVNLMAKTYGNNEDWIQYSLNLTDEGLPRASAPLTVAEFNHAATQWLDFRSGKQNNFDFPGTTLVRVLPSESPLVQWPSALDVKVSGAFINSHNDIWQPQFTEFMRRFIGMRFSKVVEASQDPKLAHCKAVH